MEAMGQARAALLPIFVLASCGPDPFGTFPATFGDAGTSAPDTEFESASSRGDTGGPGSVDDSGTEPPAGTTSGNPSTTAQTSTNADGTASGSGSESGGEPGCAGFDPNGVAQIYCTNDDKAEPWTLGFDDWESRTRSFGDVSGDDALTIVEESGQVRMTVMAVESDCEGNTDHGEALEQGYMCGPNDWRNWEMTGYFQLVDAAGDSSDQDWTIYGNGGRHTGGGAPTGCLGSAYKASYHYADAEVRFAKESWHVNYDHTDWEPVDGGIDYTADGDAWLGMKLARYEFESDGEVGVRLELWLDLEGVDGDGEPANAWELVNVREDHPGSPSWGSDATDCGAPDDDQIMLWGAPWVTWRWDGTTSRLRLMSVREILPP
jgi:hypothetical protein